MATCGDYRENHAWAKTQIGIIGQGYVGLPLSLLFAEAGFHATSDISELARCDAILICLPTPLGKHREPDLSYVLGAARDIDN